MSYDPEEYSTVECTTKAGKNWVEVYDPVVGLGTATKFRYVSEAGDWSVNLTNMCKYKFFREE